MSRLYSDLKLLHFNSKLRDIINGKLSAPIHVRLKPTNRCNHACYYCCYRNKKLYLNQLFNENDVIPWDKMRQIIADLKDMEVRAVSFSGGGEPLCYPRIEECVEELLNSGIKIGILTNGSLLKGRIAKILGNGATWVRISMDAADSQSYAKIRMVGPKEFDRICDNIYNFTRNKKNDCQLGINFVVTKENYTDIYRFLKLMKNLGVNNVKIGECVVSVNVEENRRYFTPFLNSAKKQINKAFLELASKNFIIFDRLSELDKKNNNYKKNYTRCPFIQCMTIIAADMNVYTCQDKAYTKKGKLCSIKYKRFREAWFSIENKKRLEKLNPSKVCIHHCTQHRKNLMLFEYFDTNNSHVEFV